MVFNKVIAVMAALACSAALAQQAAHNVEVKNAWVRATVHGQTATGAFMTLTAKEGVRLVGGSSPAAGVIEVHEMKMDGDIMRMRALPDGLALPAGQAVSLKPGSHHLMLMNLKATLTKESSIPLTLVFKDAKGTPSQLELKLPVALSAPGTPVPHAPSMNHGAHAH